MGKFVANLENDFGKLYLPIYKLKMAKYFENLRKSPEEEEQLLNL